MLYLGNTGSSYKHAERTTVTYPFDFWAFAITVFYLYIFGWKRTDNTRLHSKFQITRWVCASFMLTVYSRAVMGYIQGYELLAGGGQQVPVADESTILRTV